MKNDLKISILSIACVLCTSMAMPAFGASSVRSLGGAGTYSSASSAASVKSGSASAADKTTGTVRGGSVRVNSTSAKDTSGVRASSSRVSAAPRLSIGKYLAGSTAVSGGGSNDKIDGELSDNGNLQQRIRILEAFMGFSSTGDNIPEQFDAIQVDVEKLKGDLAALSDGQVTDVTYASGVLTVVKGGDEIVYNLADDFAGMSAIAALETSLDDLQSRLEGYAKLSDLNGYLKSADLSDLEDAVAGLTAADVSMNSAIAALQGGKVSYEDLNSKVGELQAADADLQAAIDALENALPSTDGLVNKDYVDGVIEGLKAADKALQDAINAIVAPDVNKAYVDAAIDSLNAAIDGLGAADAAMEQTVAELRALIANAATKEEIKGFVTSSAVDAKINEAIAGLASQEEIKGFVTSGKLQEEIAKLATKDEIANFVTSNDVSTAIENATKDLLTADDVVDFVKSGDMTTAIANATSGLATKKELADAKSELDEAIKNIDAGDVDLTNYYTKAEIDDKLALKADKSELTPLATTAALESAVTNLTTLINNKQAAGDYLVADDLATLESAVAALQSGKADASTVAGLQSAIENLGDTYATDAELSAAVAAVEAKIPTKVSVFENDAGYITNAALSDYAKTADVNAELGKKADVSALTSAVSALEAVDDAMDAAIQALQGGMITESTLNAKVDELKQADKQLQGALAELEENMPSIEGLAEKTYVDGLVSALELADAGLQQAINAIEKPDVNKAYVDAAIANLNTAITGLQAADTSMGQTVESLQASLNTMATKQELADVKSELQAAIDGINAGDVDLTNYYTKAEIDDKLALKADKTELTPLATTAALESAVTNLTTLINNKQAAGDYLVADDLAELESAVAALETDKATVADLQALQTAVSNLGETYATDAELSAAVAAVEAKIPTKVSVFENDAGYITNAALSDYAKTADVNAELANKANTSVLQDYALKTDIAGFVTGTQLAEIQETLNAAIAAKQDKGDYAAAADLTKLQQDVAALQAGGSPGGDVSGLVARIETIENTYATDAELSNAIDAVKALIPSTDGFMALPSNPGMGSYVMYASCTNKKCNYKLMSIEELGDELGLSAGNIGGI